MGRRAAPQPLRLSESQQSASSPSTATGTGTALAVSTSASASASASASLPASASATTARDQTDPAAAKADPSLTAETARAHPSSAGALPSDPNQSSQTSPRISPFTSRFNTRRPQTSRGASDDHIANRQKLREEHPPPPTSAGRADASYSSQTAPLRDRSTSTTTPATADNTSAASRPQEGQRLQKAPTEHRKFSKSKGGFFHFAKSSKTNNQLQPSSSLQSDHKSKRSLSRGRDEAEPPLQTGGEPATSDIPVQNVHSHPSTSELSITSSADRDASSTPRKSKPKPFGLLGRSRSIRDKNGNSREQPVPPIPIPANSIDQQGSNGSTEPKTAPPVGPERSFRDMMNSSVRNHSEDRVPNRDGASASGHAQRTLRKDGHHRDHSREKDPRTREKDSHHREKESHHYRDRDHKPTQSALRETGSSSGFFSGLRSSSTKAADMISKGLFGKSSTRTNLAPVGEPTVDDEHYELKVINLPLVQQTRKTRISKRLESSRDKTEFWMPAFPWRAIDYLNYKGCEVEGLYRVPGSGPQIKRWQRRFDEDHDVNLFEVDDLYDINIVGSMLKAWLRELPDELFPKAAQERVLRECAGAEEVPQLLIDELSNLSPFNYYLLFAITCHLSLLLAHSEKNKMDFRNLCICFQPCMKIDAFCFKFLVCDWRDCWKGCKNEAAYIDEEYKLFDQPPPRGLAESQQPDATDADDKPLKTNRVAVESDADDDFHDSTERQQPSARKESSSASSKHSYTSAQDTNLGKVNSKKKPLPLTISANSMASHGSSLSTDLSVAGDQGEQQKQQQQQDRPRVAGEMRPLSPIQPLSPIGF